jgi:hypothetical protein
MDQAQLIDVLTKELIRRLGLTTDAPQEKRCCRGRTRCMRRARSVCVEYRSSGDETPDWTATPGRRSRRFRRTSSFLPPSG